MKVTVNLALCAGHARCHALAPEVFDTDAIEGKAIVRHTELPPELLSQAMRGARSCPERAITIHADDGQDILWPPPSSKHKRAGE
jgi:ferredoxin